MKIMVSFKYLKKRCYEINKTIIKSNKQYYLLNDKKYAQKYWSYAWCTKKSFDYRFIHQNSLTSCLGL